jgi:hypothetical protein
MEVLSNTTKKPVLSDSDLGIGVPESEVATTHYLGMNQTVTLMRIENSPYSQLRKSEQG